MERGKSSLEIKWRDGFVDEKIDPQTYSQTAVLEALG